MTNMTDKTPSNSYEMVEIYAKGKGIKMTSQKIKNLRTTLKKFLKYSCSFSNDKWGKIDEFLKKTTS